MVIQATCFKDQLPYVVKVNNAYASSGVKKKWSKFCSRLKLQCQYSVKYSGALVMNHRLHCKIAISSLVQCVIFSIIYRPLFSLVHFCLHRYFISFLESR